MLYPLIHVLELVFIVLLSVQVLYLGIFSFASVLPYKPTILTNGKRNKIAVLVPAYKEDRVIVETAQKALAQSYPKELYEVVILADQLTPATLKALGRLEVRVIEVHFENSTKAKSLNKGLGAIADTDPDIAVVLDADNIMEADFLEQINAAYNAGHHVIQGHRTAKNQDTSFALLDAINEEIGNSIFRKGHRKLGASSALIGSGMAFDFKYFKELMSGISDIAGEDKLLEIKTLKAANKIEYLPAALVFDEKVSGGRAFSKQRTRWFGAQLYFLKQYFFDGIRQLLTKGNFDYFDKAFQMALVPKVLLIGMLLVMAGFSAFGFAHPTWPFLAAFYFVVLLLAIPRRFYNFRLAVAILSIPKAIIYTLLGILKIRRSTASTFEVTEKGVSRK